MIGLSGFRSRVVFVGPYLEGTLNPRSPFPVRHDSDYSSRSLRLGYFIGLHYNEAQSVVNHKVFSSHPSCAGKEEE